MVGSKLSLKPKYTLPAIAASLILGYVVVSILAAGPAATFLVKNGTLSGSATVVSNTSAIGGSMVRFGSVSTPAPTPAPAPTSTPAPAGSTSCALPKYPTPSCTGVPAGTTFTNTVNGSYTATTANQVIDRWHITGDVTIAADNVTIKNSVIDGSINNWNGGDPYTYTVMDTTVGPVSGCVGTAIGSGRFTALRVHVRNSSDGFRISRENVRIEDSYVHLCSNPGDHSDGIQTEGGGGANAIITHNTIDQRDAFPDVTAVLFWQVSALGGSVITNNLLAGGSYTIRIYKNPTTVTGNRIVNNSWEYGPVNSDCAGIVWSDNILVNIDTSYSVTSTLGPVACQG